MKDLLKLIIENLVENKEAISINEVAGEKTVTFEVKVDVNIITLSFNFLKKSFVT